MKTFWHDSAGRFVAIATCCRHNRTMPRSRAEKALEYDFRSLLTQRLMILSNTLGKGAVQLYAGRYGVPLSEWRMLAVLASDSPSSVNDLARVMATDKSWISRTTAALARKGLVSLQRGVSDARRVDIALTDRGRALYERILPAAIERQRKLLAVLSSEERAMLDRVLNKLQHQAETLARDAYSRGRKEGTKPLADRQPVKL